MTMTPERAQKYGYIMVNGLDGSAREMAVDLLTAYLAATGENERLRGLLATCRPRIADMARTWQAEADLLVRIDQALKQKEPKP